MEKVGDFNKGSRYGNDPSFDPWKYHAGHPEFEHIGDHVKRALQVPDDAPDQIRPCNVVVIGQGNVALDCARILAKGSSGLVDTDIGSRALSVLGEGVQTISIVGRRGHVQGAFTIKELRELTKLEAEGFGASFHVRLDELDMGATEASQQELQAPSGKSKQRSDQLLRDAASVEIPDRPGGGKRVNLRFLLNPVRFEPSSQDPSRLGAVVCERTRLEGPAGSQNAVGTGELETIEAQLVRTVYSSSSRGCQELCKI
jgi:adrenodoxin-NADP+ reductase